VPNWIRWILLLPAAVLAYFLVQVAGGLASETWPLSDSMQDFLSQIFNSVLGPWALVRAGSAIAPWRNSFTVAVLLSIAYGLLSTGFVAYALINGVEVGYPTWWFVTSSILGLGALFYACHQVAERRAVKNAAAELSA